MSTPTKIRVPESAVLSREAFAVLGEDDAESEFLVRVYADPNDADDHAQNIYFGRVECAVVVSADAIEVVPDAEYAASAPSAGTASGPDDREYREQCEWRRNADGHLESACGLIWALNAGTPAENGIRFCLGCGHIVHYPPTVEPSAAARSGAGPDERATDTEGR